MNKLKKYSNWIAPFLFLLVLIIVYTSLDNISSLKVYLYNFQNVLKPFFLGFIIAYILNLPAKRLENFLGKSKRSFFKKHKKGISILTVIIIAILFIVVTIRMIVPELYSNLVDLYNNAPGYISKIMEFIDEWQKRLDLRIFQDMNKLNAAKAIEDYIKSLDLSEFSKYAQGVISITSGVINTFISIVAAIYMLIDKQLIIKSTKNIISVILSKEKSESICGYFAKVNDIFSKYIYCKVVEAIIISIITTIALSVLGVKYAMILGLMAGFLNLIPYFGSIIGTIVIMIIALVSGGIFKCIWTGITLTILEQIDGNYIGPKIMGEVLEIRPLAVIFAVSVGGGLFGIPGMLFSIPISVVIKMMYEDYANKKRGLKEVKEDSSEVPPENDSPQKE